MLRDYLPVLLQIIVVALFVVSALLVSILVGKRGRRSRAKDTAYECGMIPQGERQLRFRLQVPRPGLRRLEDPEPPRDLRQRRKFRDGLRQHDRAVRAQLQDCAVLRRRRDLER